MEHDVEARNAQLAHGTPYRFTVVPKGERVVVAVVSGSKKYVPLRSVTFSLEHESISVHDNEGKMALNATLTLNDDGECRLRVKGKEKEFWQFRRMALDPLFFDPV